MKGVIRGHGAKKTWWIDGKQVTQILFNAMFPDKPLGGCASLVGWEKLASDALAVHPKQIKAAMEDAKTKGLGEVEFNSQDGRPIFHSRGARNAYLRAYGYFDKDAGYGDPAKGSNRNDPGEGKPDVSSEIMVRVDAQLQSQIVDEIVHPERQQRPDPVMARKVQEMMDHFRRSS